jgi:protein SCO1/2
VRGPALLAALALAFASPAAGSIAPQSFSHLAFQQHPGAQLPLGAGLRDESGRPISLGTALGGKPAIVVMEYLHCANLCGLVLRGAVASMREAHLMPGRDVELVAISIDPRDTPHDAGHAREMYAEAFGSPDAAGGMHFLTGSPDAVRAIAAKVGFPYRYDKASGQFAHPAGFVVTTPSGTISRYVLGLSPAAAAVRTAVGQAAAGEVTPPAHPLLLLCFGYDPDPQTAAALALRLVRWVSAATVGGLLLLVLWLARRRTS